MPSATTHFSLSFSCHIGNNSASMIPLQKHVCDYMCVEWQSFVFKNPKPAFVHSVHPDFFVLP